MNKQIYPLSGLLLLLLACGLGTSAPTPPSDLFATLSASTPLSANPAAGTTPVETSTFASILDTPIPPTISVPTSSPTDLPKGQIVFTCQIFKLQASDQVCIINADGTGFRRLTTDDSRQHYYPSLSPDGKSVVYVALNQANSYEIYEMNLASNAVVQLTDKIGNLRAPEISPDGKFIVFSVWSLNTKKSVVWKMDRDGQHADKISRVSGWDPTWSTDAKTIFFVSDVEDGIVQLLRMGINGKDMHRVESQLAIGGRSDLSPDGQFIVTYSGAPWNHEVYLMDINGLNARMISPEGGNSQGPSFSPDGQWVTFTAYYHHSGDENGCEIYVMRVDGTNLRRLTDNDYCDYQPRWGP